MNSQVLGNLQLRVWVLRNCCRNAIGISRSIGIAPDTLSRPVGSAMCSSFAYEVAKHIYCANVNHRGHTIENSRPIR
jgi:hypothetical protein